MSPFSSLALLFIVLVCAGSAYAQSDNLMRQPEVFGQFGMARVAADERAFSSGVEFGARQLLISPAVIYRWSARKGYVFAGGGLGQEWTKEKHSFPDDLFYQSYRTAPAVSGTTLVGKTGYVVPVKGHNCPK